MNVKHPLELEDTRSGEHFVFLRSARSEGGRFRFRWTLAPGRTGPGEHVHPTEVESFVVVSGVLRIWIGDEPRELAPGDTASVPAGVRHRFLNPGTVPVVVDVDLDGTAMEDQMIPMSAYFQQARRDGRMKPTIPELFRILVHVQQAGAVALASRTGNAAFGGLCRTLRLFGVQAFPAVTRWEPPAGRAHAAAT